MNVTSLIGNKVKLNNGTVVLDTQKTSTSSKPEEAESYFSLCNMSQV